MGRFKIGLKAYSVSCYNPPVTPRRALLLALLFVPAACAALPSQAAAPSQKDFDMHFYAPFLEPGLGDAPAPKDGEMIAERLEWSGPDSGRLLARMWDKKAVVEFKTSPDRKTLTDLRVDLGNENQPGRSGLDVWRHRHAYIKGTSGYVWNSLEDRRPALDSALGADYDAALLGAWRLWSRRKLARLLGGSAMPEPSAAGNEGAELNKKMRLRYDKRGLVGKASGDFFIRLWQVPVRVRFEIEPNTPTHHNPWIIKLSRPIDISYTPQEWRRRHGYAKAALGGYTWDGDFIEPKPDITSTGPRLDDLLARAAGYWADAGVSIIMDGLDKQLKSAVSELGGSVSAYHAAPRPNFDKLREIQARRVWP